MMKRKAKSKTELPEANPQAADIGRVSRLPLGTVLAGKYVIENCTGREKDWILYQAKDYFSDSQAPVQIMEFCPAEFDVVRGEHGSIYARQDTEGFEKRKKAIFQGKTDKDGFEENQTVYLLKSWMPASENADGIPAENGGTETRTKVLSEKEAEKIRQKYLSELKGEKRKDRIRFSGIWWIIAAVLLIAAAGIVFVFLQ